MVDFVMKIQDVFFISDGRTIVIGATDFQGPIQSCTCSLIEKGEFAKTVHFAEPLVKKTVQNKARSLETYEKLELDKSAVQRGDFTLMCSINLIK